MRGTAMTIAALLMASCGTQTVPDQPASNALEPAAQNQAASPSGTNVAAEPPLAEPRGAIDPKSAEAAGQVVQHYGALIEQKRFPEGARLWSNADDAGDFALQLRRYPKVHIEIGKPGDMEGAAGSSYITVPVTFYGSDENGNPFHRGADVILRRVNDVPGSTAAQRRWHITRIVWYV